MAAQHMTVTMDSATFKLVMECAGRGFLSQHLVIKYKSNPSNETIRRAAGNDKNIPKL